MYIYIYIYTYTYMYIYIYIVMCCCKYTMLYYDVCHYVLYHSLLY